MKKLILEDLEELEHYQDLLNEAISLCKVGSYDAAIKAAKPAVDAYYEKAVYLGARPGARSLKAKLAACAELYENLLEQYAAAV